MRCLTHLTVVVLALAGLNLRAAEPYTPAPGPDAVATLKLDWHDATRNRDVPVKIYYPKSQAVCLVIIFSHGLGGSRDGYSFLGEYWASHGYVSVHLQHIGSDTGVWLGQRNPMAAMRKAAVNPANLINRPLDVRFAIDELERLNKEAGPLKGRLDLSRIGMAGHSFGAYTTMAVVGEEFTLPNGKQVNLNDPRIKAGIAMSSPVPRNRGDYDAAYGKISVPVFHMTGTLDNSPVGDTTAAQRRIPFDHMKSADTYLLTFTGGDHMVFSGRLGLARPNDKAFQNSIKISSLAFWDAYLKDDAGARQWLAGGGFKAVLGSQGTFEIKAKP